MKSKFFLLVLLGTLVSNMLQAQVSPTANFKADITRGCTPVIVNFQDLSTGNPTSWSWNLGNGSTSTLRNPTATYFAPGTKTITLIVTNNHGTDTIVKEAYITVSAPPDVNFSFGKGIGCTPFKVQFEDSSIAGEGNTNVKWLWDLGNGTQSTEQNPEAIYTVPDNYTIALTVTNDKGCSRLISKQNAITVVQKATADFTNSVPRICNAPAAINFINNSQGAGTMTYTWDFGDGTSSIEENPKHTYASSGTYPITLISTSEYGCADTLRKDSAVKIGGFTTDFSVVTQICKTDSIYFVNISSPRPVHSLWQFPDGTLDTALNPVKRFTGSGTFAVKLINTFSVCTDSLSKDVTIMPHSGVNFVSDDTSSCQAPFTVNFKNLTQNGVSYKWNFGDGTASTESNPIHTYTSYGKYTITLIATSAGGCSDTLRKTNYINVVKVGVSFANLPKSGCIPYTINPVATVASSDKIVSYQWDFGDGTQSSDTLPTYTYTEKGTYTVTLSITTLGGCTSIYTLQKAVKVGTKQTAEFVADKNEVCAIEAVHFTNQSSTDADSWQWIFGDGTTSMEKDPTHLFVKPGLLTVQLIAYDNGCASDTIVKKDYVAVKPPIASFVFKPNCSNRLEYTFTDRSIEALTWHWDFGDGTTSDIQNPQPHIYKSTGTYKISLFTTNGACTYLAQATIQIVKRNLDFKAASRIGCKPFNAVFTPTAADLPAIRGYSWNFGNGNVSASNQAVYTKPGIYNITLITTDSYGCRDTVSKEKYIQVNGPTAAFSSSATQGCGPFTTTFTDNAQSDGINKIVSWKWDLGNKTVQGSAQQSIQNTYDSAGVYTVKLKVTDSLGCSDSAVKKELIKVSFIKAAWNADSLTCPKAPIAFTNQSYGSSAYSTTWNFGDGQTAVVSAPSHGYSDTGLYTVRLIVRNAEGCTDSLTRNNYIQVGRPVASFTANNFSTYCTPFKAIFTNTSTFFNSSFWNVGIATSKQVNTVNYYTAVGTYDIKLLVTSPGGCKDSVTKQLHVYDPNQATLQYSPLNGCTPVQANFSAFTGMKAKFVWDFGDGNVVDTNTNAINHIYKDLGRYLPKVILEDTSGKCKVLLRGTDTIRVSSMKARFEVDKNTFCDNGTIKIKDSIVSNTPITKYSWDFGDNTTSDVHNPVHYYEKPGLYNVSLTVNTSGGCNDTLKYGPVKVAQSPFFHIKGDSVICVNQWAEQLAILENPDTSPIVWNWKFPNGAISINQKPASQQYTTVGDFTIYATSINNSGCADTVTKNIHVRPLPTVRIPTAMNKTANEGLIIPGNYSTNIISYTWSPEKSLSCADCPNPVAKPDYTTKYTVNVVDSNGCKNSATVLILVSCKNAEIFVPNTFSPNGDGSNDVFYVRGHGPEHIKSFRILNRWGEVVFERRDFGVNDISTGWNGSYKGGRPQPGVYVYQLEAYCESGEVTRFEGNVALIQ